MKFYIFSKEFCQFVGNLESEVTISFFFNFMHSSDVKSFDFLASSITKHLNVDYLISELDTFDVVPFFTQTKTEMQLSFCRVMKALFEKVNLPNSFPYRFFEKIVRHFWIVSSKLAQTSYLFQAYC